MTALDREKRHGGTSKAPGLWCRSVVDASGNRRPVKASGQLTYDPFGNMTVRGVIHDPAMRDAIVLDFDGRIVIHTRRREFRAADITPERPIHQDSDRSDLAGQAPTLRADARFVRRDLR